MYGKIILNNNPVYLKHMISRCGSQDLYIIVLVLGLTLALVSVLISAGFCCVVWWGYPAIPCNIEQSSWMTHYIWVRGLSHPWISWRVSCRPTPKEFCFSINSNWYWQRKCLVSSVIVEDEQTAWVCNFHMLFFPNRAFLSVLKGFWSIFDKSGQN